MAHTFDLSTRRQRQENLSGSETSLVYPGSFTSAGAIGRLCQMHKKEKNKNRAGYCVTSLNSQHSGDWNRGIATGSRPAWVNSRLAWATMWARISKQTSKQTAVYIWLWKHDNFLLNSWPRKFALLTIRGFCLFVCLLAYLLEIGTHYLDQAGFKLASILLSLPPN